MNKLSDLELCKKIAEIENWEGLYLQPRISSLENVVSGGNKWRGKALLLDLMLKHGVSIDRHLQCPSAGLVHCSLIKGNMVNNQAGLSKFIGDDQFPRAVLECIVEANNG